MKIFKNKNIMAKYDNVNIRIFLYDRWLTLVNFIILIFFGMLPPCIAIFILISLCVFGACLALALDTTLFPQYACIFSICCLYYFVFLTMVGDFFNSRSLFYNKKHNFKRDGINGLFLFSSETLDRHSKLYNSLNCSIKNLDLSFNLKNLPRFIYNAICSMRESRGDYNTIILDLICVYISDIWYMWKSACLLLYINVYRLVDCF